MPLLAPSIGEERLLIIGLLASCGHVILIFYLSNWSTYSCQFLIFFSLFCRHFSTASHGHIGYLSFFNSLHHPSSIDQPMLCYLNLQIFFDNVFLLHHTQFFCQFKYLVFIMSRVHIYMKCYFIYQTGGATNTHNLLTFGLLHFVDEAY